MATKRGEITEGFCSTAVERNQRKIPQVVDGLKPTTTFGEGREGLSGWRCHRLARRIDRDQLLGKQKFDVLLDDGKLFDFARAVGLPICHDFSTPHLPR